jgi:hypothetical protein
MKTVFAVLVFTAATAAAQTTPHARILTCIAYQNLAVAQSSVREGSMLVTTGRADWQAVNMDVFYGDLVATLPTPAKCREFGRNKNEGIVAPMMRATMFMLNLHANTKGMVTYRDESSIVWWIE